MRFNIHGKKVEVTEPIKNYIEEKIGNIKYTKFWKNLNVHLRNLDCFVQ